MISLSIIDFKMYSFKHLIFNNRYGQHVKTFTDYDARDLLRLAKDDLIQMVSCPKKRMIERLIENLPGGSCGRGPVTQRLAHEASCSQVDFQHLALLYFSEIWILILDATMYSRKIICLLLD